MNAVAIFGVCSIDFYYDAAKRERERKREKLIRTERESDRVWVLLCVKIKSYEKRAKWKKKIRENGRAPPNCDSKSEKCFVLLEKYTTCASEMLWEFYAKPTQYKVKSVAEMEWNGIKIKQEDK